MQPGPFHVAFAIPDLGGGGAERVTLALARGLIARGHSVDLLLFHDKIVLKEELPPEARLFKLRRDMPLSRFNYLHAARELGAGTFFFLRRRHLQHALSIAGYLDREQPDFLLPGLAESKIASLVAMRFANHRPLIVPVMHNNLMKPQQAFPNPVPLSVAEIASHRHGLPRRCRECFCRTRYRSHSADNHLQSGRFR